MALKALIAIIALAAIAIGLLLPTPAKAPRESTGRFAEADLPGAAPAQP